MSEDVVCPADQEAEVARLGLEWATLVRVGKRSLPYSPIERMGQILFSSSTGTERLQNTTTRAGFVQSLLTMASTYSHKWSHGARVCALLQPLYATPSAVNLAEMALRDHSMSEWLYTASLTAPIRENVLGDEGDMVQACWV